MSKPGEPRIKINPSAEERHTLKEWLEIEEAEDGMVTITHFAERVERYESEGLPRFKAWITPDGAGYLNVGTVRLHRRDLCALADWVAFQLWKPEDDEAEEHKTIPATDEPQSLGDA